MAQNNIKSLEDDLWESADALREGSKLSSQEYCMPVLGLIYLRYAFTRFKYVEAEILKDRPSRNGVKLPVESSDFKSKSAIFLPENARYDYLLNLPKEKNLGEAVDKAMEAIEKECSDLSGILPKNYQTIFKNDLLKDLLRLFNNDALNEIKDDVIGRIYEYFLNKFAKNIASDDGVFFTPKSLVRMIVNIIQPTHGKILDPACGSGGMFVSSGDFVNANGINASDKLTFFGQEKVEFNAKLCKMNMAVHGLNAKIISGDEANSFYNDYHKLEGKCDYVMANPPFNVNKVKYEAALNAGRLPFGLPGYNEKTKEIGNANYLWISYFYAYLNETGRAGFVMASSATDSQHADRDIRSKLVDTGDVDVILSVGNNFFYTLSLPCTLWFFDKGKKDELKDKVLFIDARNYFTVIDRNLNEWTKWQIKNLSCIVHLYRGETEKYKAVINDYCKYFTEISKIYIDRDMSSVLEICKDENDFTKVNDAIEKEIQNIKNEQKQHEEAFDKKIDEALKTGDKKTANIAKREKKNILQTLEGLITDINEILIVAKDALWLTEKFGSGEWKDIPGLCKIATRKEIAEKNYSLTPGAYVGVAEVQEDDENFEERMKEIHAELNRLQNESNDLMATINANLKDLGLEA
ncbi:MAG: SAM-dependent DNA methyltransferase [Treponema sp.]|nr:SAM-dependent DNA methyltransferase [Treponema sp.]MBR5032037.1 SAM-dependent DNA methyltransferase [Treponema sp.]